MRRPGTFGRDDFLVDEAAGTVMCPQGVTVTITPKRGVTFGVRCRGCPQRARCTTSATGKTLHLHPHDAHLVENRRSWREGDFADDYRRWRPMVERTIAWLVAKGNRRVRFRGVDRNDAGLTVRVAALNLRRLVNLGLDHDGAWVLRGG